MIIKLEELTQDGLDELIACAEQRSLFAATIAGVLALPFQSEEALSIKKRMIIAINLGLNMGLRVGDYVEKETLIAMKNHCEEQIGMEELLDSIK
jgi:hypothetical protein